MKRQESIQKTMGVQHTPFLLERQEAQKNLPPLNKNFGTI